MLIAFWVLLIMISVNLIYLFVYLKPMKDTNFFDYLIWSWLLLINTTYDIHHLRGKEGVFLRFCDTLNKRIKIM